MMKNIKVPSLLTSKLNIHTPDPKCVFFLENQEQSVLMLKNIIQIFLEKFEAKKEEQKNSLEKETQIAFFFLL